MYERKERCTKSFGGETQGMRLLGKHRHRWDNIKIDLQAIRWEVWTGFIWLKTETSDRLL